MSQVLVIVYIGAFLSSIYNILNKDLHCATGDVSAAGTTQFLFLISIFVCVCVCVCVRERSSEKVGKCRSVVFSREGDVCAC